MHKKIDTKTKTLLLFLLFCIFSACSTSESKQYILPIEEANFIAMMAEIHIAEAAVKLAEQTKKRNYPFDLDYIYGSIFKKYNFSQEKLENLLLELAENPKEMQTLFKKVEAKISEIQTTIKTE